MRRTRKLFTVILACAGVVVALLLTAVLTTRLLANRDVVKSFLVTATARATGGTLAYERLDVSFMPLPHLEARSIQLNRPAAFDVTAQALSVYPRILPLLRGQVSIRQLALVAPNVTVRLVSEPKKTSDSPMGHGVVSLQSGVKAVIGGLFGALTAIDPGTALQIEEGTLTLTSTAAPDVRVTGINAAVGNEGGDLSLNLHCRSDITGRLEVIAMADTQAMQASGQVTLSDMNVRPLIFHDALPGGITTDDTHALVKASFTVDGPETVHSRFELQLPSLTVMRRGLKLKLDTVAVSGAVDYADKRLSLSMDTLRSAEPALDLSATANLRPTGDEGRSVVEVRAAAGGLDVAVAGAAARAVAGDLNAIRTAFSVAKEGRLAGASYFAGFAIDQTGWHLTRMQASGHLTRGLVTIPGIEADLEGMDGEVVYEDRHVAFKNVSGHFKGAAFKNMDAAIDWEKESTLAISSRSVEIDTARFFPWITGFQGLDAVKNYISTTAGIAQVTGMKINGPLTRPQNWAFAVAGTPQEIRITSPRVPFEIRFSGGEIVYIPGYERATNVKIEFLDGSFVSSYQSKGIVDPESMALQLDGSMGPAALAWLTTMLPIPTHLQMKPPIDLSGVIIAWNNTNTLSVMGAMKTAGGVELFADFAVSPQDWQIRRIQFADGSSRSTVSARKHPSGMELSFSGNVEKATADRLLEDNRTLSGRLEGDFHAVIDTGAPINSSFSGMLKGEGLHLFSLVSMPIDVRQFSITGSGGQLTIEPSEVSLGNSRLVLGGGLDSHDGNLVVDLNVDADRLDEELIRAIQPPGKDKAGSAQKRAGTSTVTPRGVVHLKAKTFSYGGFTWSPVQADIRLDGDNTQVQVDQANLCGISTTGALGFSSRGVSLHITPTATGAILQDTVNCLWNKPVKALAQYDLSGEINLPPVRENATQFLSGQMEFSSENGKIEYSRGLMKIFSVLNITEVFTGGKSDLVEVGYGYTKAYAKAEIGGGKLQFSEILLDGSALKITGQGFITLDTREADITLLAAPLKTIDRVVNQIPLINYIAGDSLISIPLQVTGPLADIKVKPMRPSAVGKGVLNLMERTLKAPFKLVQSASEFAEEELSKETPPTAAAKEDRP